MCGNLKLGPTNKFLLWIAGVVIFGGSLCTVPTVADDSSPQEFQWNVLLGNWHVIGPFTKSNNGDSGLGMTILDGEPNVDLDKPVQWQNNSYEWKKVPGPIVDFQKLFSPDDKTVDNAVAYAWTQFTSPDEMVAVLSLGHDDALLAWLNGEEVFRYEGGTAAYLDQSLVKVRLRKGTNTLLLKVGQLVRAWEVLARLLPDGVDKPLITLKCDADPNQSVKNLPILDIDLLDADAKVITTLRTNGFRVNNPERVEYIAYDTIPEPAPEKVRIRYRQPGCVDYDQTFSWSEVRNGKIKLTGNSIASLKGRVLDANTEKPIAGAQFYIAGTTLSNRSKADGAFTLAKYNPFADTLWIAAPGYEAQKTRILSPPTGDLTLKLSAGAQVLRGRVTTVDQKPIAGATVRPGLSGDWAPEATTDMEGNFEILGIPANRKELYPTIIHPDYVAKDRFNLPLEQSGVTKVNWTLASAGAITGRVTAKDDDRPLMGVRIQCGTDRFMGSNSVMPEAITDADGRFRLGSVPPGQNLVHAFSDDFAPAMSEATVKVGKPIELNFTLEPGKPATGHIVDPQGNPLKDVWLVTDTWNGARMFRRETRSDEQGRFELPHMPDTPAVVQVIKQNFVSKRDLSVTGGENYDLVLQPVVTHTIRIRTADTNQPPASLDIKTGYQWSEQQQIYWQGGDRYYQNYNQATGVMEIRESEPTSYKRFLRFRAPGYQEETMEMPSATAEAQSLEIVLQPEGTIKGRVVDAGTGQPVEGVTVAIVNKQDRLRLDHYVNYKDIMNGLRQFSGVKVTSGNDGSFNLSEQGLKADADLVLLKEGQGFHYMPNAKGMIADGALELPMPKGGAIEGRILAAGKPLPEERVHLAWIPTAARGNAWEFPFGWGGQANADKNGRFRYEGLGPGRYSLARVREFKDPGGMSTSSMHLASEEIVLLPGQTLKHDLSQPAGHTITGVTLDPDGKPLGNCQVSVSRRSERNNERIDAVLSDAEGKFKFVHLPAEKLEFSGEYYTRRTDQGYGYRDLTYRGSEQVEVKGPMNVTIHLGTDTRGYGGGPSLAGQVPPELSGKIFDTDQQFNLSDQWGKVVVLDFWGMSVGQPEIMSPEMKKVYEEYKDREDVKFVAVCMNGEENTMREYLEKNDFRLPVIFTGKGWNDPALRGFAMRGWPCTYVIGRDGRLAADVLRGGQIAVALKTALDKPLDPAYAAGVKPARLVIKFASDQAEGGLPGTTLQIKTVDAQGNIVREEKLSLLGQANQMVWLYPPLDKGGKIAVTARAEGLDAQIKTLDSPDNQAEVVFNFTPPRRLTGRVTIDEEKTPAPNLRVHAMSNNGLRRTGITDAQGRFSIPVFPGDYYVMTEGNEKLAAMVYDREATKVPADTNPEPMELKVCHTIIVKGKVKDEEGNAVVGARVQSSTGRKPAQTDDQGQFEISGVPSKGKFAVHAAKDNKMGILEIEDIDPKEPIEVVLGQMPRGGPREGLHSGQTAPKLKALSLQTGAEAKWKPAADKNTLVVFCALWHPAGREFIGKAQTWAKENNSDLTIFSIDWTPEQAKRTLKSLPEIKNVFYAGPGGLAATADWGTLTPARAFLLSPKGKILKSPELLKLP